VMLEATLQWEEDGGSIDVFDGFIHQCELLDHPLPATAKVFYGYKKLFIEVACIPASTLAPSP